MVLTGFPVVWKKVAGHRLTASASEPALATGTLSFLRKADFTSGLYFITVFLPRAATLFGDST